MSFDSFPPRSPFMLGTTRREDIFSTWYSPPPSPVLLPSSTPVVQQQQQQQQMPTSLVMPTRHQQESPLLVSSSDSTPPSPMETTTSPQMPPMHEEQQAPLEPQNIFFSESPTPTSPLLIPAITTPSTRTTSLRPLFPPQQQQAQQQFYQPSPPATRPLSPLLVPVRQRISTTATPPIAIQLASGAPPFATRTIFETTTSPPVLSQPLFNFSSASQPIQYRLPSSSVISPHQETTALPLQQTPPSPTLPPTTYLVPSGNLLEDLDKMELRVRQLLLPHPIEQQSSQPTYEQWLQALAQKQNDHIRARHLLYQMIQRLMPHIQPILIEPQRLSMPQLSLGPIVLHEEWMTDREHIDYETQLLQMLEQEIVELESIYRHYRYIYTLLQGQRQ